MTTLAAYTGPTPPTGYVGYVNLSLVSDGVRVTVRPESADGSGTVYHTIPAEDAVAMFTTAIAALRPAPVDGLVEVVNKSPAAPTVEQ